MELLKKEGADLVTGHLSSDAEAAAIITGLVPEGVDLIIEMLANANLASDFDVLKKFGRICVVGNRGSLDFNPRLIMGKEATVTGMTLPSAPPDAVAEIRDAIFRSLSTGDLRPIVSRRFSLAEAPAAHHAVIEDKAQGKIILVP